MDRRLTLALAAALGLALLVIAFLLGRQTAVAPSLPPPIAPTPEAAVTLTAAPPLPLAPNDHVSSDLSTPEAPAPLPSTAPLAPASPVSPGDPMRAQVARYFTELDALQAEVKAGTGDPEAVARAILKQATEGGSQELDALLSSTRNALTRMRSIQAPAPCIDHHQRSVALAEESLRLMEQVRRVLAAGSGMDASALTALTTTGRDIESRAREVDALGAEIKKNYGV